MASMNRREAMTALSGMTLLWSGCGNTGDNRMNLTHDVHSYAQPEKVRVRHVSLDLTASFERRTLSGTALLSIERSPQGEASPLILDTRDLQINGIQTSGDGNHFVEAKWGLGKRDPILGAPLTIELPRDARAVAIQYETSPQASGLQWLEPAQTADKRQPFLYSQNESIHARSWIPIQDSPGVRMTYSARIHAPRKLLALMSAEKKGATDDVHEFSLDLPIPAYLIALAIGDLQFQEVGPRTGVYTEPSVLGKASREFSDMEAMVQAVERLYGPYRWGRYDLLILPPSFPFGGMENPRLTFATPTVIAGDKSLVGLVSHELAHSWSGNLVTNATWSDFWLNEGFTTYIENRIQEAVYGKEQALMEQVLGRRELEHELRTFDTADQILHINLNGRDPDEGTTEVPYIKGSLFLRQLENVFGRPTFDAFLKSYFNHFAFHSIDTSTMLDYMQRELFGKQREAAKQIPTEEWIYEPGLPASAPKATSQRLEVVGDLARQWSAATLKVAAIHPQRWSTQEWLEFLQVLPSPLNKHKMAELDQAFHFTKTGNDEILDQWLKMAIAANYEPAYPRLRAFLMEVGRQKFIKPLYTELMKTAHGRALASEIYSRARPRYHPIAQTAIDKVVKQHSA
jgi:leukotriene-A4 hydrolase